MMRIAIKRLHNDALLPTKNNRDGGYDLYALEDVKIHPGETVKVRTGIACQIETTELPEVGYNEHQEFEKDHYCGFIWDRSSLGSKGIHRMAGVIDQDYTGELLVCLTNLNTKYLYDALVHIFNNLTVGGRNYVQHAVNVLDRGIDKNTYKIKKGDKIAQIEFHKVINFPIVEVEELTETSRGEKGFGSTGK